MERQFNNSTALAKPSLQFSNYKNNETMIQQQITMPSSMTKEQQTITTLVLRTRGILTALINGNGSRIRLRLLRSPASGSFDTTSIDQTSIIIRLRLLRDQQSVEVCTLDWYHGREDDTDTVAVISSDSKLSLSSIVIQHHHFSSSADAPSS